MPQAKLNRSAKIKMQWTWKKVIEEIYVLVLWQGLQDFGKKLISTLTKHAKC